MASNPLGRCCIVGVKHKGTPQGEIKQIDDSNIPAHPWQCPRLTSNSPHILCLSRKWQHSKRCPDYDRRVWHGLCERPAHRRPICRMPLICPTRPLSTVVVWINHSTRQTDILPSSQMSSTAPKSLSPLHLHSTCKSTSTTPCRDPPRSTPCTPKSSSTFGASSASKDSAA